MRFEIDKGEKKSGGQKRYRLEVSLTGAMGLGTVLVLGLVWVFIFGVLVGRGYQPEDQLPELARIMPEAQAEAERPGVIKPEDLRFHDALRHGGDVRKAESPAGQDVGPEATVSTELRTKVAEAPAQPAENEAPAPLSAEQTAPPAEPAQVAQAAAQPAPQAPAAEQKPVQSRIDSQGPVAVSSRDQDTSAPLGDEAVQGDEDQDQTVYDYVYQVASLSKPEAALKFRDQVRSLGLQSEVKVVKGENQYWHRVVVLFQGRPVDTREMKAKLKSLGVDKPLLRSKEPRAGQAAGAPSQVLSRR